VTHRGNDRRTVFYDSADFRVYRALLRRFAERHSVRFWSYCLMGTHVHLIAVPPDARSLARAIGATQQSYSLWFHARHGGTGHLWGNRYFSTVLDSAHLLVAVRYVELNPVRAGIARRAAEYAWSSAAAHALHRSDPLLDPTRPFPGAVRDWAGWLESGTALDEIDFLRARTRTGRPAGSHEFVHDLERRTGRELEPKRPGRRPKSPEPVVQGIEDPPSGAAHLAEPAPKVEIHVEH
jgi:putative transposase